MYILLQCTYKFSIRAGNNKYLIVKRFKCVSYDILISPLINVEWYRLCDIKSKTGYDFKWTTMINMLILQQINLHYSVYYSP